MLTLQRFDAIHGTGDYEDLNEGDDDDEWDDGAWDDDEDMI
jgi:hypothetical protein